MSFKEKICFLFYSIALAFIVSACKSKNLEKSKTDDELINYNGIYISRDTLFSIDKNFKNEITVSLIKFNKNQSVQTSNEFTYRQDEADNLTNSNILKWLHNFSSYNFIIKDKNKLNISCYFKRKRAWNDFATSSKTIVNEYFTIKGDTLFRNKKFSKNFKEIYILHKQLTNNHKKIGIRNACE
jgi:hypothetical protein